MNRFSPHRRPPLWAGVIALADQQAGRHLGFVNPAIYAIARGPA
jgi:subtilase family serine protease